MMCFAGIIVNAQNKLTIVVTGFENPEGHVLIAVYGKDNFMKNPSYVGYAKVEGDTANVVINDIKPGEYAISLFHDENDNKKLDMGTFGPTEKYGFSNNASGKMGPPKYDDCKFVVEKDEDTEISITVI